MVVVIVLFCLTSAFEAGLLPLAFRALIDDVLTPRNDALLAPLLAGLIAAGIAYTVIVVMRDVLHARVSHALLRSIRHRLYLHFQHQSVGFHTRTQTAGLLAHFTTDLAVVENGLITGAKRALIALFSLLVSAGLLFALEWPLALLALAGLPLSTIGPWLLGSRASRASRAVRQEQALLTSRIHEDLAAHPTVLAFGMQDRLLARFREHLTRFYHMATHAQVLGFMVERTPNVAMLIFNLLVLAVGAILVARGSMTVGSLVAFYTLSTGLRFSVANMASSAPHLMDADAALRRMESALAEQPEVTDMPGAGTATPLSEAIEFDRVEFGYGADRPILRSLSLRVPRGMFCTVVGPSGAGKSTVIALLLRFFDVGLGTVRWDGADLRQLSQVSLRAQMAVVFQDNVVFNASVRDNLTVALPDATEQQIRTALRDAELLDHIESLADGLDTMLGERGVHLSGGQRQRLAIARALLRDPSVLVLDEATSALDSGTEAQINETLHRISRGRTVICVTHRLATAVNADMVFVLENGSLAEAGSHEALLRSGRLYPGLWAKQDGITVSADGDWATVDATRLRAVPLLRELSAQQLETLAQQFHAESFQAEREIVREGDPGDRFYLIARGEVAVSTRLADGSERRLALLRDGDHFGEVALLHDRPRTATVTTTCPTIVLSVHRRQFLALIEGMPDLHETLSLEAGRHLKEVLWGRGQAPHADRGQLIGRPEVVEYSKCSGVSGCTSA